MGERFNPNNVVRGRFGRSRGDWLSPSDYDALTVRERQELWARRKHERQYRPTPARYRKGHYARQRITGTTIGVVLAVAICAGLSVGLGLGPPRAAALTTPMPQPEQADGGIRVQFSACKWGGGTNCVVDGDTIYLHGQKIRLAGIDAPETHDYGCASELDLGERAASRLQALLNSGGAVTLSSIDRDQDRYGRKLRNVAVGGADVGETLIGEGLARDYAGGRRPWCG